MTRWTWKDDRNTNLRKQGEAFQRKLANNTNHFCCLWVFSIDPASLNKEEQ